MAFDAFALVLAMLVLGYLFQRLRVLPESAAQTLNLVVLYVCLPAAVLRYGELAPYDTEVVERCLAVLGERDHPVKALLKGRLAASGR